MGTVLSATRFKTTLPWSGKATGFCLSAKLPDQRHRPGQIGFLVAPVIRPLATQQSTTGQIPDISNENIFNRSAKTMTGLDLERNRLGRSLPFREGYRPLFQVIGRDGLRNPIQSHGYLHAPVGMAPHLYWVIALENNPVAIIFRDLQNGIVRIGVLRVLRLESSSLFQVVLFKNKLAFNKSKGSRR